MKTNDLIDRQAAINALIELTQYKTKREIIDRCNASIADEQGWLGGVAEAIDAIEDMDEATYPKAEHVKDYIIRGVAIAYACSGLIRRMDDGDFIRVEEVRESLRDCPSAIPDELYEYHYDHTDCIWYRPEARNRCPSTCAQYRDGWNDAMQYIFRDGKGYRPYRRGERYE